MKSFPNFVCWKLCILMAKKEKIKSLFDNIAPDYDKLNHILSLNIDKSWRRKAVREIADSQEPLKVLDVACGTADFTIEIATRLPADSSITGVDLSEGMMKIGREKIAAAGLLVANVLIVNNYRDMDDDKAVGKRTTVVIFGRKVMGMAYLLLHIRIWSRLVTNTGAVLNQDWE